MGIVPEFISKLVGGKKDATIAVPPVNNGPSPVIPDATANTPPVIMDPLVTSRPEMPEAAPTAFPEQGGTNVSIDASAAAPAAEQSAPTQIQDKPIA